MTLSVWGTLALVCGAAVAASADAGKSITVTGCVQNISAKGPSGPTEKGYLLTNVATAGDPLALAPVPTQGTTVTGAPTGTSGTAASGMPASGTWAATTGTGLSASRANTSFILDGHEGALKNQVGHQVEIKGTVQPRPDDAPKSAESHLQIESIRVVSSRCSSKSIRR